MSYASEHSHKCLQPECPEEVPASRWDMIRAQAAGWFFPRDDPGGRGWCPAHKPAWVDEWRKRQNAAGRIVKRWSRSTS